jgi:hypothetical protein
LFLKQEKKGCYFEKRLKQLNIKEGGSFSFDLKHCPRQRERENPINVLLFASFLADHVDDQICSGDCNSLTAQESLGYDGEVKAGGRGINCGFPVAVIFLLYEFALVYITTIKDVLIFGKLFVLTVPSPSLCVASSLLYSII